MSELINTASKQSLRHTLLVTVSAATLLNLASASVARANDVQERPTVWIEVGGQLDRVRGQADPYAPPFTTLGAQHGLLPIDDLQAGSRYSKGEQGSISFQPENSGWKFSASVLYGRANGKQYRHQQFPYTIVGPDITQHANGANGYLSQTSDYSVRSTESHAVVDFKVGKEVGLGLWKESSISQIALGVRFAQFSNHTKMDLHAIPNPHFGNLGTFPFLPGLQFYRNQYYSFYRAKPEVSRNFSGWGPTISWDASISVTRTGEGNAGIALDFAANAGVLFGRQKLLINHHTTGDRYEDRGTAVLTGGQKYIHAGHYVNSSKFVRSRSVIVPNIGGSAGLSLKIPNAKISVGYRADFFFGAMDGGVEQHKVTDRSFYGPFATVSIGLGG